MWGAIIGDMAGSIYEYGQVKKIETVKVTEIIRKDSFYSDDTILTIAVLQAILKDRDYEKYLRLYGNEYANYRPNISSYFKTSFAPGFIKWLKYEKEGVSIGNGAMMRISPVGFMFDSENEVIKNARLATIPSHDSKEAVCCSTIVALVIYYARNGMNKEQILKKLNIKLKYNEFKKFNTTCLQTIDNCLFATFTSNNFEESIKNVISYGGDTDTNACIVGSMSEALYGIDKELIEKARIKLPQDFVNVLDEAYRIKCNDISR